MKRMFFSFLFVIFLCYGLQAQVIQGTSSAGSHDFRFGAKAGLNVSTLSSNSLYDYTGKPGFHIGGVVEIPFSDMFLLQPEALFSLQGSGYDYVGYDDDNTNLFYFTVPVLLKYNVWDELYIEGGPQIGILLGDNVDDAYPGLEYDTNMIDAGLAFGAGYRLNDNFYFQGRFNIGFINAIEDTTSKNRVFQLSAVYFF